MKRRGQPKIGGLTLHYNQIEFYPQTSLMLSEALNNGTVCHEYDGLAILN